MDTLKTVPTVFLQFPYCADDRARDALVYVASRTAIAVMMFAANARRVIEKKTLGPPREHFIFALDMIWQRHADQSLDAADVACSAQLSLSHLSKVISKMTGHGLGQHIRSARICHAVALIAMTRLSMKEIAAQSGFADTSSLDHQFGATFSMTPSEFQKRSHPEISRYMDKPGLLLGLLASTI